MCGPNPRVMDWDEMRRNIKTGDRNGVGVNGSSWRGPLSSWSPFQELCRWICLPQSILADQRPVQWKAITKTFNHMLWENVFEKWLTVLTPIPWSINTTSSVATLPVAPLAKGQPPSPDTDESTVDTPYSSAVRMLANAWPYVSWQWTATASMGINLSTSSRSDLIVAGVPIPMVSPRLIS